MLLAGCRTAGDIVSSGQLKAALEATGRLRTSFGDGIALVAVLPGPAAIAGHIVSTGAVAADIVLVLGQEFLAAGADVIVVHDKAEVPGMPLTTLANVARPARLGGDRPRVSHRFVSTAGQQSFRSGKLMSAAIVAAAGQDAEGDFTSVALRTNQVRSAPDTEHPVERALPPAGSARNPAVRHPVTDGQLRDWTC